MSALFAPIMMVIQTGAVMHILFGSDTGWNPQRRDDGSIPLAAIIKRHRSHVLLGFITLIAAFLISPSLAAWMSPTIIGLLLSIVLSYASGLLSLGLLLRRRKLLLTPEEGAPPPIATRANEIAAQLDRTQPDIHDSLVSLRNDPDLRAAHIYQLNSTLPLRARGDIDVDHALAQAKLYQAQTFKEAMAWLKPKERMAVLHDRLLIDRLCALGN